MYPMFIAVIECKFLAYILHIFRNSSVSFSCSGIFNYLPSTGGTLAQTFDCFPLVVFDRWSVLTFRDDEWSLVNYSVLYSMANGIHRGELIIVSVLFPTCCTRCYFQLENALVQQDVNTFIFTYVHAICTFISECQVESLFGIPAQQLVGLFIHSFTSCSD